IQVIQPEEAEGRLAEIYNELEKSRGKIAEVHKIQSLNPETITNHMDLYLNVMFGKSPLSRYQREMMAVVVSRANECTYCQRHHMEALEHFWKNPERTERLRADYRTVDLSAQDRALCDYAWQLTLDPGEAERADPTMVLRSQGLSDRAILDATLVVSYFNFVNRMVLGLGVELEQDPGGYEYE
ncbi:MAG: peroxidase-related enzyme, partial [Spirochaetaceae bacterium]